MSPAKRVPERARPPAAGAGEQHDSKPTSGNLCYSKRARSKPSIKMLRENMTKSSSFKRESKLQLQAQESPSEWLPAGWSFETRTRMGGSRAGQTYKSYIEESSGFRFYSKLAVFRYLNIQPAFNHDRSIPADSTPYSCSSSNQKQGFANSRKKIEVHFDYSPPGLPFGWIKEIRIRKSDPRRRDLYYIDPVTGYKFRSLREVSRFLEKGEISARVARQKSLCAEEEQPLEKKPMFLAIEKPKRKRKPKPKQQRKSTRRCLFSGQGPVTDLEAVIAASTPEKFYLTYPERSPRTPESYNPVEKFYLTYPDGVPEKFSAKCISGAGSSCSPAGGSGKVSRSDTASKMLSLPPTDKTLVPSNEPPENGNSGKVSMSESASKMQCLPATEKILVSSNKSPENGGDASRDQPQPLDCKIGSKKRARQSAHETGNLPEAGATKDAQDIKIEPITFDRRASKRLAGLEADAVETSQIGDRSLRVPTKGCGPPRKSKNDANAVVALHLSSDEGVGQYKGVTVEAPNSSSNEGVGQYKGTLVEVPHPSSNVGVGQKKGILVEAPYSSSNEGVGQKKGILVEAPQLSPNEGVGQNKGSLVEAPHSSSIKGVGQYKGTLVEAPHSSADEGIGQKKGILVEAPHSSSNAGVDQKKGILVEYPYSSEDEEVGQYKGVSVEAPNSSSNVGVGQNKGILVEAPHSSSNEGVGQYKGILNAEHELLERLESKKHSEEEPSKAETMAADVRPSPSLDLQFRCGSGAAWSDPCLEFAFKTLTGDIPLDSVAIESYFQNRGPNAELRP